MTKTVQELLSEARAEVKEISVEDLVRMQEEGELVLLDVRERQEAEQGMIPGAQWLPRGFLELQIEGLMPRERPVALYCAGGSRSVLAANTLRIMGYQTVYSLAGGIKGWADAGRPLARP